MARLAGDLLRESRAIAHGVHNQVDTPKLGRRIERARTALFEIESLLLADDDGFARSANNWLADTRAFFIDGDGSNARLAAFQFVAALDRDGA
jgi:hypothetical protein